MAGWFELSKSNDDQYRFVLKAGNGEMILTGELYTTKSITEKGVASIQANSPLDEHYERKTAANDKLHFSLKAADRQIIGSDQLYVNERSRKTGIASVKTNGASRAIKDKTW